jgi:8-oxo-dGTP diphosphatase
MTPSKFNIRAYMILLHEGKILIADERIKGSSYIKLPGGGLEFGEGPRDCILREAQEELGQEVEVLHHVHTTEMFVQSKFYPTDQVVAIYYQVQLKEDPTFRVSEEKHDFQGTGEDEESFRWVDWDDLKTNDLSFETDRAVIRQLKMED